MILFQILYISYIINNESNFNKNNYVNIRDIYLCENYNNDIKYNGYNNDVFLLKDSKYYVKISSFSKTRDEKLFDIYNKYIKNFNEKNGYKNLYLEFFDDFQDIKKRKINNNQDSLKEKKLVREKKTSNKEKNMKGGSIYVNTVGNNEINNPFSINDKTKENVSKDIINNKTKEDQKKPNSLKDKEVVFKVPPPTFVPIDPFNTLPVTTTIPQNKIFNINITNPLGNYKTLNNIFQDSLPLKDKLKNFTFSSLYERNVLKQFISNIIIKNKNGENINEYYNDQLISYIKLIEYNPYLFRTDIENTNNNFLLFNAGYPIVFDESTRVVKLAQYNTGLQIRIYPLNNEDIVYFNNGKTKTKNKSNTLKDIDYYTWIQDEIINKKISPNFVNFILYKKDLNSNIIWSRYNKIVEDIVNKNKNNIIHKKPLNYTINTNPNDNNKKSLILLTEAPTLSLIDWMTPKYSVNNGNQNMDYSGFHEMYIWDSILFQIFYNINLLIKKKLIIKDFSLDNLYIKDTNMDPTSKGFWIYNIDNINYYVPNYGFLLLINVMHTKDNDSLLYGNPFNEEILNIDNNKITVEKTENDKINNCVNDLKKLTTLLDEFKNDEIKTFLGGKLKTLKDSLNSGDLNDRIKRLEECLNDKNEIIDEEEINKCRSIIKSLISILDELINDKMKIEKILNEYNSKSLDFLNTLIVNFCSKVESFINCYDPNITEFDKCFLKGKIKNILIDNILEFRYKFEKFKPYELGAFAPPAEGGGDDGDPDDGDPAVADDDGDPAVPDGGDAVADDERKINLIDMFNDGIGKIKNIYEAFKEKNYDKIDYAYMNKKYGKENLINKYYNMKLKKIFENICATKKEIRTIDNNNIPIELRKKLSFFINCNVNYDFTTLIKNHYNHYLHNRIGTLLYKTEKEELDLSSRNPLEEYLGKLLVYEKSCNVFIWVLCISNINEKDNTVKVIFKNKDSYFKRDVHNGSLIEYPNIKSILPETFDNKSENLIIHDRYYFDN